MDEDQRAELRYELADRIDRLWDLLGLSEYSRPGFDCTEGTRLAVGADGRIELSRLRPGSEGRRVGR